MSIPLLVIVGPTASGKSRLAVRMAKRLSGEVISADSMQLYRGMDIATAKPSEAEKEGVPHHLLDVLDPEQSCSVVDYLAMARPVIADVARRGRLPVVAGGTGLYLSALLDNLQFPDIPQDEPLRAQLRCLARSKGSRAVYGMLCALDPASAAALHHHNTGRVIRALEVYIASGIGIAEYARRSRGVPSPYDACVIGLCFADRSALYARIDRRVEEMLSAGLAEEARAMLARPLSRTASQAIGYKELRPYLEGKCALAEAAAQLKQDTRNYAKRQMTWFGRDERVQWLHPDEMDGEQLLEAALRLYARHFEVSL